MTTRPLKELRKECDRYVKAIEERMTHNTSAHALLTALLHERLTRLENVVAEIFNAMGSDKSVKELGLDTK